MKQREPDEWMSEKACGGDDVEPNIFFPVSKRYLDQMDSVPPGTVTSAEPAKRVCRRCPVIEECLTFALSQTEVPSGVWGGRTDREMKRMKREAR